MTENNEEVSLSIESCSQNSDIDAFSLERKMIKQLIEKQNEQDRINKEVIKNQQKLMEELRLIRNEQNGRKRELKDKYDSIENPAKKTDLDTSAVDESGQIASEHNYCETSIPDENPKFEKTGKWFTLKHTFKNVSKMENGVKAYSEQQEHFGVCWRMHIYRNEEHLAFHTRCENETAKGLWSIEADWKIKLFSKNEDTKIRKFCKEYKQVDLEKIRYPYDWGWEEFKKWDLMEKEFLIDDSLTIEVSFKIRKMTGIYKNNLRNFDDPECSDVVLIVQDQKFHVLKLYLATHSSYFKAMFLGMFGESKKSEIPLTGIDADDFQKYLEVLYGDDAIDEYTVEGILMVSDMYDTQIVIKKCQQFLLEKSKKTLKKKLELSVRYNLEELKKKCLSEIKTIPDIRRVIPGDIEDMDSSLMVALFKKAMLSN